MNSKNWIQFVAIFLLFFTFGNSSKAQLDTEFWFAPPELTLSTNETTPRDRPIQLVVSTLEKPAIVRITQPADLTFVPIVINMAANTTHIQDLSTFIDKLESKPHNTVLKTGIYIKSTNSISAYYEIKSINNTDIFALKGLNGLGKLFYTPFQTHWDNSLGNSPSFPPPINTLYNPTTFASFDIIATDDTTLVTVTPTKDLVGHPAGIPFSFTLHRGQVYSCRAASRLGPNHPAGSKIVSSKDVAVTIKDDMLRFLSDQTPGNSSQGADLAGDQLIPVDFLGKNYVLVKGGLNNNADRCYILATEDNTIIRVDGNPIPLDTLNEGEQYELQMLKQSYFLTSNKNVCVWHISGGGDQIGGAIIPSLNCTGTNRIGFTRTNSAQFIVNVITKSTAINNFTLNGNPSLVPGSEFQPILGSNGWMFARISFTTSQIPAGTTLLLQNSGDELFHVGVTNNTIGAGSNYGYFSNFSRLNLGSVKNVCQGDTALIDAGPAKTSYLWNTGETSRIIQPLNPGKYWVNTLSGTQCPKSDTVQVFYYNPTFTLGPDDTICVGSSRRIIPDGVFTFKWQDGTTSSTYLATQAGKYFADVKDFQGCPASDTILIAASPRPATPVASIGDTVCKGQLVNLSVGLVPNARYGWADPDSIIISGRNITVNTAIQKAGTYKAFVKINGCESFFDTSFVGIVSPPPVSLGKDTVLCNSGSGLKLDAGKHINGNTYVWSNNSTDSTLIVNSSGDYSVSVTSQFGCVGKDTIDVLFQGLVAEAVFSGQGTFCQGQTAGFGVVQQADFIYEWTGPNGFNFTGSSISIPNVQLNSSGSYSVTPKLNGCSGQTTNRNITINNSPNVNLGKDSSSCIPFSLLLDPLQFGKGTTYLWNDASTDSTLSVNQQGTYFVNVSNGTCFSTDTITLTFGKGPSEVNFTGIRNYCANANASFGVVPVSGETYAWTGPNGFNVTGPTINFPNIQNAQAGQYTVTPGLPNCPGTPFSLNIIVRPSPIADLGKDTSYCLGSGITLDPTPNGGEDVFYQWSNNLADSSIFVSQAGTYSVIATLGLCSTRDTIKITSAPIPSAVTFNGVTQYCPGQNVNFGVNQINNVRYNWSGPNAFVLNGSTVTIPSIQTNQGGFYKVIPFLNGCPGPKDSVLIDLKSAPVISLPNETPICNGASIILDPVANGKGFTYVWSTTSTDSAIVVSSPGKYKVLVSNGICSSTDSIQVINGISPGQPIVSGILIYCEGQNASFGVDTVSGVVYSWTGPNGFTLNGPTISITNSSSSNAGQYTVTPSLNGCNGTPTSVTIFVGTTPSLELGNNDTICNGSTIVLDPIGSSAGLTFLWSNNSVDSSITVSTSGKYVVTVSNNGCSRKDSISLTFQSQANTLVISGVSNLCQGKLAAFNVASQPGVNIIWSGPNGFTSTGNSILLSNLQANQAGSYIASTAGNACPGIGDTILLSVNQSPQIELGADLSICNGTSFNLDPAPNGAGFTYLWNTGSTDSSILVSTPGKYKVTVTNGSTCSSTDSVNVTTRTSPPTPVITGSTSYCSGSSASFGLVGASILYSYSWTGPNGFTFNGINISIPNITTANAGIYTVTPSDAGCNGTPASVTISVGNSPILELGANDTLCNGSPLVLDPIGSSAGLTFVWSNNSTDSSITVSTSGKYVVRVSNNGCTSKDSISLTFGAQANTLLISGVSTYCQGQSGTFGVASQAGISVNWSGPNAFTFSGNSISIPNLQLNQSGRYIASTSQNACPGIGDTILLTISPSPQIELGADRNLCIGVNTTLDPTANGAGLTYTWSNGSTDSSIVVSTPGKYVVTVSNAGNCKSKDSVNVFFSNSPGPVTFTSTTAFCAGSTARFGVIETTGLTYAWTGPNGFTFTGDTIGISNISATNAGQYTVTPSLNSCAGTASSITISIAPGPNASLGIDRVICGNTPVVLDPGNGLPGYQYLWNAGNDDSTIVTNQSGSYSVTVSYLGCSKSDTINLTFKPLPIPVTIEGNANHCSGDSLNLSLQGVQGGTVYNWTGPGGFTFQSQTILLTNITAAQSGTYTVTPGLDGCPGTPTTINIVVRQSPLIELGPVISRCAGSSYTLVPTPQSQGLTFLWNTGSTDSNLVVAQTGLYAVAVSNTFGCTKRDTTTVTFNLIPVSLTFTGDTIICAGETASFGVQPQFEVSNSWTDPLGFVFAGDQVFISPANITNVGYYVVQPSGNGGCLGKKDSVFLLVSNSPIVSLGADRNQCGNNPITLKASSEPGNTYLWNIPGSIKDSLRVIGTGIYSVIVTNASLCSAFDTVSVLFKEQPKTIVILNGSKSVCDQTIVNFEVEQQEGVTFSWIGTEPLLSIGRSVGFKATLQNAGNYTISSSINGCPGPEASVTLQVKPNPFIAVSVDTFVCNGLTKVASANTSSGASTLWSDNSSQTTAKFGVGLHWGQASFDGCSVRDTFLIRNSGPTAKIGFKPGPTGTAYELVQFIDSSKTGASPLSAWEWQLGESQLRTAQNPSYTYTVTGDFDIQLIVKDQAGCSDTAMKTLTVEGPKSWSIPSLFTPNGDGENDTFVIIQLDLYPGTEVNIYNRWGNKEFGSKDYKNDWGGSDLVEGVYFYTAKRNDGQEFKGSVYLKR